MAIRLFNRFMSVTVLACLLFLLQPAHAAIGSRDLQDFQVSGPVGLMPGQNASVCATNLDNSPASILIALLDASNSGILAVREAALQPGEGVCLNFTKDQQPNGPSSSGSNVVGLIVPNGRVDGQGAIVQSVGPGGGCIAASLQIQLLTPDNTLGQTLLFAPMLEHHERHPSPRNN
jgi:hypothetical protein